MFFHVVTKPGVLYSHLVRHMYVDLQHNYVHVYVLVWCTCTVEPVFPVYMYMYPLTCYVHAQCGLLFANTRSRWHDNIQHVHHVAGVVRTTCTEMFLCIHVYMHTYTCSIPQSKLDQK